VRLLRIRGFGPLLAGQAVNAVGDWVAVIAIWGIASFRFDAGATDLATLIVVLSVPGALLGPLLGVPIDRLGPRRALIVANGLGVVDALLLTQAGSYRAVILLALPLGLIEALGSASLDALPPRLVPDEDLLAANALLGMAQHLAIAVGPVVAALVNLRWGLSGAFLADAATFAVGVAVVLPLDLGPVEAAVHEPTWTSLREGFRLARHTATLRWTLSVAGVTYSLWALFAVLEPLYVRDVLHRSGTVFAFTQAVFGAGLVIAGLALTVVGDRVASPRHVAVATVLSGATAALYMGTRSLAVALVGVFLWGIDVAFFAAPAKTLLQRGSPPGAHGRILSLNQTVEPVAHLVTAPLAVAAVAVVGIQVAGVTGGAIAALTGLLALRVAGGLEHGVRPRRRHRPDAVEVATG